MVDYQDSSQLRLWLFDSPKQVLACRAKANRKARDFLMSLTVVEAVSGDGNDPLDVSATKGTVGDGNTDHETTESVTSASANGNGSSATTPLSINKVTIPVNDFACGFRQRCLDGKEPDSGKTAEELEQEGPWQTAKGHAFLTPQEEAFLVSFYVSKLPLLLGPSAQLARLRRESKVTATAVALVRRFFCSNSVMLHDPKAIMVAAAFLGSKVEDAMTDVRYLEEGTALMNAPVHAASEIIPGEIALLQGTNFNLLCFHPYKAVVALTEDLRTYLKSDKGQQLVLDSRPVSGQDLKPLYEAARQLLDDVMISDLPLVYTPGQIGMAALMVAQDQVLEQAVGADGAPPRIDLQGYLKQRFPSELGLSVDEEGGSNNSGATAANATTSELLEELLVLCDRMRELGSGAYGCTKYELDLSRLKKIHKKLKKVRMWGQKDEKDKEGSQNKKRAQDSTNDPSNAKRPRAL